MSTKIILTLILLGSVILPPAIVIFLGIQLFHLPCLPSVLIGMIPLLTIGYAILVYSATAADALVTGAAPKPKKFKQGAMHVLANLKYHSTFPVGFYYEPEPPKHYKLKSRGPLNLDLKAGDVLLRRMENYLVGLILEQNSYYTHAAICVPEAGENIIYEAVGAGVRASTLDAFLQCDDVAVFRINYSNFNTPPAKMDPSFLHPDRGQPVDPPIEPLLKYAHVKPILGEDRGALKSIPNVSEIEAEGQNPMASKDEKIADIGKYMRKQHQPVDSCSQKCLTDQLNFFDQLIKVNGSHPGLKTFLQQSQFEKLACAQAKCLVRRGYDYSFDFSDFTKVSCIEFVWYCYWALQPVHRIQREKFRYFSCITAFILVPDSFLKSSLFERIYPKETLPTKKRNLNFWLFLLKQLGCLLILLVLAAIIRFLIRQVFPG